MAGGVIVEVKSPVTQTTEATVLLLKYLGKPFDPLPQEVRLPGAVLVLSNKKDCYYVTTEKACSCPSATYRPGQSCKHQRKHYPQKVETRSMADALDSIRPTGKWAGGHNGPVLEVD